MKDFLITTCLMFILANIYVVITLVAGYDKPSDLTLMLLFNIIWYQIYTIVKVSK